MELGVADTTRCAVLFFEGGVISRRLLYVEFESVLDHIVAIKELSDRHIQAVFVDIDGTLNVSAAVFFWVRFDGQGMVSEHGCVYPPSLLQHAVTGPDLGSGSISLVSRAQCPQGGDPEELWEPLQTEGVDEYAAIAALVRENVLALSVTAPPGLRQGTFSERPSSNTGIPLLSARAAAGEPGEQRPAVAHHDEEGLEAELLLLDSKGLVRELIQERRLNETLRQSLAEQTLEFKQMRGLISSQIEKIEDGEQLGRQFLDEFNVKLSQVTSELQAELAARDACLQERDQEVANLRSQVELLGQANAELQDKADGKVLLEQMQEADITHFSSRPGAGEFRISAKDIPAYLASPVEYAARFCCVELSHYQAWLAHHERPVCRHLDNGGQYCDLPVHRVESPTTFVIGESDCCSQHRSSSLALSRVIKAH